MRGKATSQKKTVTIIRIIKTPIRALRKAKDIYIKGITKFSTTYKRPTMIFQDSNLPSKLTRANSMGVTRNCEFELDTCVTEKQEDQLQQPCGLKKGLQRSYTVAMGRIDEDRVSSFREDHIVFKRNLVVKITASRLSRSESRRI
uniref:uncharacterized protein LOC122587832 n=1 Tax=Erigeron canadensis TaxID=72917 RepID=UPI001CB8EDA4|nr:uncharacterized protein LOC122587832 [Erigeron canadensis]